MIDGPETPWGNFAQQLLVAWRWQAGLPFPNNAQTQLFEWQMRIPSTDPDVVADGLLVLLPTIERLAADLPILRVALIAGDVTMQRGISRHPLTASLTYDGQPTALGLELRLMVDRLRAFAKERGFIRPPDPVTTE